MAYFDMAKDTYGTVDASPVGVSAIFSQMSRGKDYCKVIAYTSRALTEIEKSYSQTQKEALANVWSAEIFHLYLFGSKFTLITEHKPHEVIYGGRNWNLSAWIERGVLRPQPY